MGLADQLGNLDYVAREVIKAEELVDYTRRENVAERLAKKFGAAIGEGAVRALRAVPRAPLKRSGAEQEDGRRVGRHRRRLLLPRRHLAALHVGRRQGQPAGHRQPWSRAAAPPAGTATAPDCGRASR